MPLPFTEDQFFDVFGAYNMAFWPIVAAVWAATLAGTIQLARGRITPAALSGLAAIQWAWTAIAYHAMYFADINPAAWLFAALFLTQAAGFFWFGILRRRLTFELSWTPRHLLAGTLLVYSLLYPLLVAIGQHALPRVPIFGVPCPLVLFTAGLLLAATPPVPRWLFPVPIVWSVIGGSAAVILGVVPDLMLFAAGGALTVTAVLPGGLPKLGAGLLVRVEAGAGRHHRRPAGKNRRN